jgi:hypothetical protein
MRQNASRGVENAIDIDLEHTMPVLDQQIQKTSAPAYSSIVDEDVDPAEPADSFGGQFLHVSDNRDVGCLNQAAVAAEALRDFFQLGLPAAAQHDGCALGVKPARSCGTDACAGASYNNHLALEP